MLATPLQVPGLLQGKCPTELIRLHTASRAFPILCGKATRYISKRDACLTSGRIQDGTYPLFAPLSLSFSVRPLRKTNVGLHRITQTSSLAQLKYRWCPCQRTKDEMTKRRRRTLPGLRIPAPRLSPRPRRTLRNWRTCRTWRRATRRRARSPCMGRTFVIEYFRG
jgi:hypothetical protein